MADSDAQFERITKEQEGEMRLKYLEFLHVAAIRMVMFASSIYAFAKENAGPLKPGVQAVEGTVKTVVGPVVDKFHGVPLELLSFVDRKVDTSLQELERHVPSWAKEAYTRAQKAPEEARSMVGEVQKAGVTGIAKAAYTKWEPVAKGLYAECEPKAEQYAVTAWRSLNQLPLFPHVAHVAIPTAAYWSDRYNQAVCCAAEKGYTVSSFLPLIPTEKIAKLFGNDGAVPVEVAALQ